MMKCWENLEIHGRKRGKTYGILREIILIPIYNIKKKDSALT